MNVACGQHGINQIPQSVHNDVNLRAFATAADSDTLIDLRFVLANSFLWGRGRLRGLRALSQHHDLLLRLPCVL